MAVGDAGHPVVVQFLSVPSGDRLRSQESFRRCYVSEQKAAYGVANGIDGRLGGPIAIVHLDPAELHLDRCLIEAEVVDNGFASDGR